MAKGPIIIHLKGQGAWCLVHYPLLDTLTAINDTQRQNYNRALICKYSHYSTNLGVSDDGDEELLRSDNYKRLFPWYRTLSTMQRLKDHLFRTRMKLNKLLRLNNALMGVVQPTDASKLPPILTPAQQQQVQAQRQAYDAQVAASRIAAPRIAPPSTQKADVPASSQSELIRTPSARNRSAIRRQSRGRSSHWVEPPLAYDNLSTPGATTNLSGQPGSANYLDRAKGNG
ncbi:uncharacterized protein EAF02_011751 [Botrytis sinoallii]|uniref:uncharacterized protein n=1 Tax=Botrytis sinoallii TaxID=1463999 RepID=UPI0018FF3518|nr:uncharacterized protein EAF02_011751 [Botrytis sinoallii]KAF7854133.1 hypothetical protein EAF02_011751 [Botrytis sinoallii]